MNGNATERTAALGADGDAGIVMPLLAEDVAVTTQVVETGRVTVQRVTRERCQAIAEPLMDERVEISRTPIGKVIDRVPDIRQEGDTVVIPIVEERLVVERQLFLKEEVRVKRVRSTTVHHDAVPLRQHDVVITRASPANELNHSDLEQERQP